MPQVQEGMQGKGKVMSGPRCSVCGLPLCHIDAACPRCLPNFYGQKRSVHDECDRQIEDQKNTIARLNAEVERLKAEANNFPTMAEFDNLQAENEKYSLSMQENCTLRARVEALDQELQGIDEYIARFFPHLSTIPHRFERVTHLVGIARGASSLEKENKILTLKCSNSLANNLCPDHRDKQGGKSCLACEIEALEAKLERAIERVGVELPPDPHEPGECAQCDFARELLQILGGEK